MRSSAFRTARDYELREIQADEVKTFLTSKDSTTRLLIGSPRALEDALEMSEDCETLKNHLELLRGHYNSIRPHRGLKLGKEVRTPAMQAGLVTCRSSFREVFTSVAGMLLCVLKVMAFRTHNHRIETELAAA